MHELHQVLPGGVIMNDLPGGQVHTCIDRVIPTFSGIWLVLLLPGNRIILNEML